MKKIISIILLLLLTIFGTSTLAYADDKEYNVESADFDVKIDKNGNAIVTEKWKVNFTKGNFTRFYISRAENINALQDYDKISFKNFKINGEECKETDDSASRPSNTYYIDKSNDMTQYEWYFDAENTAMTFETSYTLSNVVKYNDKGYAFFCYAFVGKDFEKKIGKVNIAINPPSSCEIEVRNSSGLEWDVSKNKVELSDSNSNGLVKVNIAMPKSVFSSSIKHIDQSVLDEITNADKRAEIIMNVFYCCVGIVILFIIYKIIKAIRNSILARNKDYVQNIVDQLINEGVTPFELYIMKTYSSNYVNSVKLVFLELIRRGKISVYKDYLRIDCYGDDLGEFEKIFLNQLKGYEDENGNVSMDSLMNILKDSSNKSILKGYNKNEIKNYAKKNKRKLKILKIHFQNNSKQYSASMSEILDRYNNTQSIDIKNLYYMACIVIYTTKNESDYYSSIDDDNYSEAIYYMDYHSQVYNSPSSSSSSGCSSCSSCSSCGGGGAD